MRSTSVNYISFSTRCMFSTYYIILYFEILIFSECLFNGEPMPALPPDVQELLQNVMGPIGAVLACCMSAIDCFFADEKATFRAVETVRKSCLARSRKGLNTYRARAGIASRDLGPFLSLAVCASQGRQLSTAVKRKMFAERGSRVRFQCFGTFARGRPVLS